MNSWFHILRDKCFHVDRRSGKGGDLTVPVATLGEFLDAYTNDVDSGADEHGRSMS